MAFIANKPVRFGGQTYAIGEVIPDELIDPKMMARLLGWGKILKVDLPTAVAPPTPNGKDDTDGESDTPPENAGTPQDGEEKPAVGQNDAQGGEENETFDAPPSPLDLSSGVGFQCPECGKECKSKTALTAHRKTHEK